MSSRKRLSTVVLLLALVAIPAIQTNAAVKAGKECSKVGQVKKSNGQRLICSKKGKKLIWLKNPSGTVKPVATPTSTPVTSPTPSSAPSNVSTPEPTPAATVGPIPIPTPTVTQSAKPLTFAETLWSRGENGAFPIEKQVFEIPSEIPTSWQDVYEKRLGIPYQAWLAISKNVTANTSKLGKVEIVMGPNTIPNYADIKRPMELVSRALPSARNVQFPVVRTPQMFGFLLLILRMQNGLIRISRDYMPMNRRDLRRITLIQFGKFALKIEKFVTNSHS